MADIDKAHAQRLEQYAKFAEEFEGKRKEYAGAKQCQLLIVYFYFFSKSVDKQEDWQVRLNLEENVRMIYDMQSVSARDVKYVHIVALLILSLSLSLFQDSNLKSQ